MYKMCIVPYKWQLHYSKIKALTVFLVSLMTSGYLYMKYSCFVGTSGSDLWNDSG